MLSRRKKHRPEEIIAKLRDAIKQHPFCKAGFSEAGHLATVVR
jgi:hypothetical protein